MITFSNWWWPHSAASVLSAISLGYTVRVAVSEEQEEQTNWLDDMQKIHPGRIQWFRDTKERSSKAAHTLTRFDYLPALLGSAQNGEPVMVTDADVIHQRHLDIMPGSDVALWQTTRSEWEPNQVDNYHANYDIPLWWAELACTTMAVVMVLSPTPAAKEFAKRIKEHADSLRADGFGDRWGVDQVAIHAAERVLEGSVVHRLNAAKRMDIRAAQEAAIWYPHPHERDDPNSEWSKQAAKWRQK